MESQKTLKVLNEGSEPRFVRRKWNDVNDQSHAIYHTGNR